MKWNGIKGFTLIEVMIVVLILAILAALAVPNFQKARKTTWKNICIDNLHQIESACEQIRMEGGTPTAANVYGATHYIKVEPYCPADAANRYEIPGEGSRPVCPNATAFPDHKLDDDLTQKKAPGK